MELCGVIARIGCDIFFHLVLFLIQDGRKYFYLIDLTIIKLIYSSVKKLLARLLQNLKTQSCIQDGM